MPRLLCIAIAATAALWSVPAVAGAANFTLINAAGGPMSSLAIRRVGTDGWKPLSATPPAGARAFVSFSDPDCAFDIRATVGRDTVVWAGVNLCETKSVTLNRNASGAAWVDYD